MVARQGREPNVWVQRLGKLGALVVIVGVWFQSDLPLVTRALISLVALAMFTALVYLDLVRAKVRADRGRSGG